VKLSSTSCNISCRLFYALNGYYILNCVYSYVVVVCTKVLTHRYEKVIVLEDDVRFRPFFHERFHYTMYEVNSTGLDWDLMYV